MGKAGAQSFSEAHKVKKAEVKLTTQEKRKRKAEKGKEDYKEQASTHKKAPIHKDLNTSLKPEATTTTKSNPKGQKKEASNVYNISKLFQSETIVDFDDAPVVIYDSNTR
jgi:putative transposase